MGYAVIPAQVRELLRDRIASYEELELLLLVRRRPTEQWTTKSAALELELPESVASEALKHLAAAGLVRVEGALARYAPASAALAESVEALARAYDENRLGIMSAMNENSIERVKNGALRAFADAFVFGRGGRKDG